MGHRSMDIRLQDYRAPLIGAAVAIAAGLALGAALKAEVAPESSAGQQLQVAGAGQTSRGAFADWYPAEGAPPPVYQSDYNADMGGMDDVDRQIARLMNETRINLPRPSPAPLPEPAPAPADQSGRQDAEAEPYLPSRSGDILAPADLPRWSADTTGPVPADLPPG